MDWQFVKCGRPLDCRVCNVIWEAFGEAWKHSKLFCNVVKLCHCARKNHVSEESSMFQFSQTSGSLLIKEYLFTSIFVQNQVCLAFACLPTHLLELMIHYKMDKDENWGGRKKTDLHTKDVLCLQPITYQSLRSVLDLIWELGKEQWKENNRYVEGKTSWDEGSGVENRLHQLPCSFPRTPCPYSVSHFSHNKGGNRSPGGLVSSSKIKSLPRNRLLASSYFADFDTRGICGRKEALTLNPELEAQMFPSCPAITAFLIMFVEISWSST